jgi:hypothetical protein
MFSFQSHPAGREVVLAPWPTNPSLSNKSHKFGSQEQTVDAVPESHDVIQEQTADAVPDDHVLVVNPVDLVVNPPPHWYRSILELVLDLDPTEVFRVWNDEVIASITRQDQADRLKVSKYPLAVVKPQFAHFSFREFSNTLERFMKGGRMFKNICEVLVKICRFGEYMRKNRYQWTHLETTDSVKYWLLLSTYTEFKDFMRDMFHFSCEVAQSESDLPVKELVKQQVMTHLWNYKFVLSARVKEFKIEFLADANRYQHQSPTELASNKKFKMARTMSKIGVGANALYYLVMGVIDLEGFLPQGGTSLSDLDIEDRNLMDPGTDEHLEDAGHVRFFPEDLEPVANDW